jgi:hypothetical protein
VTLSHDALEHRSAEVFAKRNQVYQLAGVDIHSITVDSDLHHCANIFKRRNFQSGSPTAAAFLYIQFLVDCVSGYLCNNR